MPGLCVTRCPSCAMNRCKELTPIVQDAPCKKCKLNHKEVNTRVMPAPHSFVPMECCVCELCEDRRMFYNVRHRPVTLWLKDSTEMVLREFRSIESIWLTKGSKITFLLQRLFLPLGSSALIVVEPKHELLLSNGMYVLHRDVRIGPVHPSD